MPRPIPPEVLAHCSDALRVLAHPVRLRIVEILAAKRLTVGEVAQAVGGGQAAVSQHLTKMRVAGLLEVEREGRSAYYRVTNPACLAVLDCIRRNFVP
jgi:DNA-binding transcriptional ArsR family regulator